MRLARMRMMVFATFTLLALPLRAQTIILIDVPGATETMPVGINSSGEVTGSYKDAEGTHGFVRNAGGTFTAFDVAGAVGTFPASINPFGEVAGYYTVAGDARHGFIRDAAGSITTLPNLVPTSINSRREIACYTSGGLIQEGFLRDFKGVLTTFSVVGYAAVAPFSINPVGEVTGFVMDGFGVNHGFIRSTKGVLIIFDVPGASTTSPLTINATGEIAGYSGGIIGTGFIRSAKGVIATFGTSEILPVSINTFGEITGFHLGGGICCFPTPGFVRDAAGVILDFFVEDSSTFPLSINSRGATT